MHPKNARYSFASTSREMLELMVDNDKAGPAYFFNSFVSCYLLYSPLLHCGFFFSSLTPATSSLRVHHIVNMVILMKIR
jgi:hypothetical protein